MTNAELRRQLRPLVSDVLERTRHDHSLLLHLLVHLSVVVGLGITAALHVGSWPWYALLGLALIAGNSLTVLGYIGHEAGHGAGGFKSRALRRVVTHLGWAFSLFATPTVTRQAHNVRHHRKTNTASDPDRRLSYEELQQYSAVARVACWLFPNSRHPILTSIVGYSFSVFSYHNSILWHSIAASGELYDCRLSSKERRRALLEFLFNLSLYLGLWALSGFAWLMLAYLALQYFTGTSIAGAYVASNHLMHGRSTEATNSLQNTISLRLPGWIDRLHLNFSHHIEHHLFPGASHKAYPAIRRVLQQQYPQDYQEMGFFSALRQLVRLPMGFRDDETLVHWDGSGATRVPFPVRPLRGQPAPRAEAAPAAEQPSDAVPAQTARHSEPVAAA